MPYMYHLQAGNPSGPLQALIYRPGRETLTARSPDHRGGAMAQVESGTAEGLGSGKVADSLR